MLDLNLIEAQIEEFFDVSGDDISSVVNHGESVNFSHISLTEKDFSYEINLHNSGLIELVKQSQILNINYLDQNIEESDAITTMKEVVVNSSTASNIQEVIEFIFNA